MSKKRESWGSNVGFLLAAVGSAVGLGNIWAFPYKMGRAGGAVYLIIYLVLAVLVGVPMMISELALRLDRLAGSTLPSVDSGVLHSSGGLLHRVYVPELGEFGL